MALYFKRAWDQERGIAEHWEWEAIIGRAWQLFAELEAKLRAESKRISGKHMAWPVSGWSKTVRGL